MRFLILGRSVGKGNKNKNKIGKGVWSYEARYLSIISVEPGNNKVWLQSQHRGNGGRKKSTSLLNSNENKEKLKICKAKNCLCFRLERHLFEIMCHCLHCLHCLLFNFFFRKRENLGRSDDAKQRKKGDGLITISTKQSSKKHLYRRESYNSVNF